MPLAAMTAGQLIELLKNVDPSTKVAIAYNYGDYYRTTVVEGVKSTMWAVVNHSPRLEMHVVESETSENDGEKVVVIRGS